MRFLTQERQRWVMGMLALLIAVLSLLPSQTVEQPWSPNDKLNHLLAYGALAFFTAGGYPAVKKVLLIMAVVAYGGVLELLQGATGYREASWLDLAADALGAVLGLWFSVGVRVLSRNVR